MHEADIEEICDASITDGVQSDKDDFGNPHDINRDGDAMACEPLV